MSTEHDGKADLPETWTKEATTVSPAKRISSYLQLPKVPAASHIPDDVYDRFHAAEKGIVTDTGGYTKDGVSENAGFTKEQIQKMTDDDVRRYWNNVWANEVSHIQDPKAREIALHVRGNAGPNFYAKALQGEMGVKDPDGIFGSGTLKQLKGYKNHAGLASGLLKRFETKHSDLVTSNPTKYSPYQEGWKNRTDTLRGLLAPAPQPAAAPQPAPQPTSIAQQAAQPKRVLVSGVDKIQLPDGSIRGQVLPLPNNSMEGVSYDPPSQDQPQALAKAGSLDKSAVVKKEGDKWKLYTKDGKRVLGTHDSADDAYAQEHAIKKSQEKEAALSDDKAVELTRAREATDQNPSDAKKESGNYRKGKVTLRGLKISIENPIGSERSGVSPSGKRWRSIMHRDYGYFLGSVANDGDHVDLFIGEDPENDPIWIINQTKMSSDEFDEPKVILGAKTEADARKLYLRNFAEGWDGLGAIHKVTDAELKAWLDKKPSGEYSPGMKKVHTKSAHLLESAFIKIATTRSIAEMRENMRSGEDPRSWWERQGGLGGLASSAGSAMMNPRETRAKIGGGILRNVFTPLATGATTLAGHGAQRAIRMGQNAKYYGNKLWTGKSDESIRDFSKYQHGGVTNEDISRSTDDGSTWGYVKEDLRKHIFGGQDVGAINAWAPVLNAATGNTMNASQRRQSEQINSGNNSTRQPRATPYSQGVQTHGGTWGPDFSTSGVGLPKKSSQLFKVALGFTPVAGRELIEGDPTVSERLSGTGDRAGKWLGWSVKSPLLIGEWAKMKLTGKVNPNFDLLAPDRLGKDVESPWLKPIADFLDHTVVGPYHSAKWLLTGK